MAKILFVADRCFLPATDGSTRVYDAWLKALAQLGHSISVLSFDFLRTRWQADGLAELDRIGVRHHIVPLVSGPIHAAALRGGQLGWNWLSGRTRLPSPLAGPWSPGVRRAMADFLHAEPYDVIIVQKVYTTELIGAALLASLPGRKIIDVHDNLPKRAALSKASARHCLGSLSWARIGGLRREEVQAMLQRGSVGRGLADEIDLLAPYDDVLFAAPEEMESYIAAGLESARCRPWAWGLDSPPEAAAAETDPAPRYDLGFIGGGNLFNVDALRFLGTAILPRLSQRLGRPVTALLAGGAAGAVAKEFDGQPGITLAPWVEDLGSFYRSVGLIIIPLLGGTGVSIKSMEAAQFGKAMVSTAIGMRGLQFRPGIDVEMAETAETFAAIAMALISDPARRLRLGASARQQAEARHSLAAFTAEIGDLIGR